MGTKRVLLERIWGFVLCFPDGAETGFDLLQHHLSKSNKPFVGLY